ncbi:Guanylate kinase [Taenia solium]|eukprot:TsM_000913000 transcript=TsM_000913000 gene=TsM_000913000
MAGLRPVVLSGPSGAGKSTLLKMLMESFPQSFAFSVSHTSRKPRPGEVHGREYNFVSEEEMLKDIADGKFLEYSQFAGNYYGTPREAVTAVLESGRICILDVDANGVRSIYAAQPPLNARFVFIGPPSIEVLESRLRNRGTETEEKILSRLKQAKVDMEFANSSQGKLIYDAHIVNDNVEEAYEKLFDLLKDDIALTLDDERQQVAAS